MPGEGRPRTLKPCHLMQPEVRQRTIVTCGVAKPPIAADGTSNPRYAIAYLYRRNNPSGQRRLRQAQPTESKAIVSRFGRLSGRIQWRNFVGD